MGSIGQDLSYDICELSEEITHCQVHVDFFQKRQCRYRRLMRAMLAQRCISQLGLTADKVLQPNQISATAGTLTELACALKELPRLLVEQLVASHKVVTWNCMLFLLEDLLQGRAVPLDACVWDISGNSNHLSVA